MSVKPTLSDDDFYRLLDLVMDAGGVHVDGKCKPHQGQIKKADGTGHEKYATYGCGKPGLMMVPYDTSTTITISLPAKSGAGINTKKHSESAKEVERIRKRGGEWVKVCGYGDRVDLWPRFAPGMAEG